MIYLCQGNNRRSVPSRSHRNIALGSIDSRQLQQRRYTPPHPSLCSTIHDDRQCGHTGPTTIAYGPMSTLTTSTARCVHDTGAGSGSGVGAVCRRRKSRTDEFVCFVSFVFPNFFFKKSAGDSMRAPVTFRSYSTYRAFIVHFLFCL